MTARPSQIMSGIGVVQDDQPILHVRATPFDLPTESADAEAVVKALVAAAARIATVHNFAKGMGLAAPQIGIGRAAAIVYPPGEQAPIVLLNPTVTAASEETDEQFEGCLSFFDVRGLVPRPRRITVRTMNLAGKPEQAVYVDGLARLVAHEVDHLEGLTYVRRMPAGVTPISVEEYRGTGSAWSY